MGIVEVGWGVFVLARQKQVAAIGARFHQRIAKAFPPNAWGNPDVSGEAWRYLAPAIGVLMIVMGVVILIFVPT